MKRTSHSLEPVLRSFVLLVRRCRIKTADNIPTRKRHAEDRSNFKRSEPYKALCFICLLIYVSLLTLLSLHYFRLLRLTAVILVWEFAECFRAKVWGKPGKTLKANLSFPPPRICLSLLLLWLKDGVHLRRKFTKPRKVQGMASRATARWWCQTRVDCAYVLVCEVLSHMQASSYVII